MPTDKKISELPIAPSINASDISVLVDGGTDYQYTFTLLLQFLASNLVTGANISFGVTLPQNISGNNGDVFINTNTGSFAQKHPEFGQLFIPSRALTELMEHCYTAQACLLLRSGKTSIVI